MTKKTTYNHRDMLDPDYNKKQKTTQKTTQTAKTSTRDSSGVWSNQTPVTGSYFGSSRPLTAKRNGEVKTTADRRQRIATAHKGESVSAKTGGYVKRENKSVGGIDWNKANQARQQANGQTTPQTSRKSVGGIDYSKANNARAGQKQDINSLREEGYNKYLADQQRKKKDMAGVTDEEYNTHIQSYIDNRQVNSIDDVFNTAGDVADDLDRQIQDLDKQIEQKSLSVTTSADPDKARKETDELRSLRDRLTATKNQFKNESNYSKGVQKREWEFDQTPNAQKYDIEAGKQGETFISNLSDDDWANAYGRSVAIGMSEDDTLKAASRFMTERERNIYFATRAKEGDEGAMDYLRNLYQYGDLGKRVAENTDKLLGTDIINTSKLTGQQKAAADVVNTGIKGFLRYGGTFTSGVGNAIEGMGDAVMRVQNEDYIHAENIGKKLYAKRKEDAPGDIGLDIAFNTGNMLPAIAVSVATQGIGAPATVSAIASSAVTGVSSFGNTYQDARRQGYTADEATSYALANGISEAALQYALNGVAFVAGGSITGAAEKAVTQGAQRAIGRLCKTEASQALMSKIIQAGVGSFGEFEEEYLQAILDPVFRNYFLGEITQVNPMGEEELYQGLLGALSAGGMNMASVAIQTSQENAIGRNIRAKTDTLNRMLSDKSLAKLPDDVAVKQKYNYIMDNGADNVPDGTIGRFAQEYAKHADADAGIKALVRGLINWNNVSDEGRRMLVDPSKAEYLRSEYGIDVNENMSPEEMKQAVLNEQEQARGRFAANQGEAVRFLRGELKKSELSPGARALVDDTTYMGWLLDQYDVDMSRLSPEARGAALDVLVNRMAGIEMTEEQRAQYEDIKKELLAGEIPFDKETHEIPAIRKFEDFLYSLNETPMTRAERDSILDVLQGYYDNTSAKETSAETTTEANTEPSAETAETTAEPTGTEITPESFALESDVDINNSEEVRARIDELMSKDSLTSAEQERLNFYREVTHEDYDAVYEQKFGTDALEASQRERAKRQNVKTVNEVKKAENEGRTTEEAVTAQVLTEMPKKKLDKKQKKIKTQRQLEAAAIELLDTGASYEGASKAIGNNKIYNAYNSLRNATKAADFSLGVSTVGQDTYQADLKGNRLGKSLRGIFNPLYKLKDQNATQAFFEYLHLMDQIDRVKIGMGVMRDENGEVITEEQAKTLAKEKLKFLKKNYGETPFTEKVKENGKKVKRSYGWEQMAEEIWKYSRNLLDIRLEAGLISKDAHKAMADAHPHYVPDMQAVEQESDFTENKESAQVASTVRRASGEAQVAPFLPIDDLLAQQTRNVMVNAKRNMLINTLMTEWEGSNGKLDAYVFGVDTDEAQDIKALAAFVEEAKSWTGDSKVKGELSAFYADELMNIIDADRKAGTLTFRKDGNRMSLKVSDGLLKGYNALNTDISTFEKGVGKFNNMFRMLITNYNPGFLVRNFFKDMGDSLFFSINTRKFIPNYAHAWQQMTSNGEIWQLYQASGAYAASFIESASEGGNKGIKAKRNAVARFTVDKIETANMVIEQAPRFAEFMTSLEMQDVLTKVKNADGKTELVINKDELSVEALDEAMYRANDITVNFARGGTKTKMLSRTFVPFLNAGVQDCTRIVRHFQQKGGKAWLRIALKATVFGLAPSLLNAMMYDDDDDYDKLSDYYKDNFFVWKYGDGQFLTVPRGRFMAVIGAAGRRIYDTTQGKDVDWGTFADTTINNIAPANPVKDNIIYPVFRNFVLNENWYGGKIDTEWELKHPDQAYDENTSSVFKYIGQAWGVSPNRLQDLFDSYGGVFADIFIPMTNKAGKYDNLGMAALDTVTHSLSKSVQYDSGGVANEYYAAKDELSNRRDDDREQWATEVKTPSDYASYYYNDADKQIDELYDSMREIYERDIPNKDKRDLVNAQKADLALLYATTKANAELLEKKIREYWDVDEDAPIEIQQRQSKDAYIKAYHDVFGVEKALNKAGINEKGVADLKARQIDLEDYYKYYMATKTGDKYMTLDDDGKTQSYTKTEKKQILLDTGLSTKSLRQIYAKEFEDDKTKKFNTIAYAQTQGVRVESFIKRSIQAAGEEGDKMDSTKTDLVWRDGEMVEEVIDGEVYVQGSKLRKQIQHLLNSGYTDKEIEYFYQKEHSTDDSYVYALASGLDAKTYLSYKLNTAELRADKDENGNSISGSLKKKIWAAISDMDISDAQKYLLFMGNYKLKKNEYYEVANYIFGLDMPREKQLKLLETLGFTISNGRVYAP